MSAKLSYGWPGLPAGRDLKLTGAYEFKQFRFSDFSDPRSGAPYAHNAHVLQLYLSAIF